ncbi:MAG: YicC/YloC family endoribonuclease, partial [Eubacteriales bacterium]|nr:YicC/YloC family endoribonuclease [Eubacteriales bacterium]
MKSMTGYGKGSANYEGRTLTVELKSVNHRYLDLSIRLPRAFLAYEDLFRQQLSLGLNRGHVDVYVNYE